jgi:hypothetical protein
MNSASAAEGCLPIQTALFRALLSQAAKDRGYIGIYRLQKNSCFVSGHGFSQAAKDRGYIGIYRLQKNSCFVSGHGFSRAVPISAMRALAPEVLLSYRVKSFPRPAALMRGNMRIITSCNLVLGMGLVILSGGVASAQGSPNTLTSKEAAQGWKLLFDGKDLDGWQPYSTSKPPATGDWVVADGAILCPGTSPGWLAGNDSYTNFDLKLQFRATEKTNSGVFIRATKEGAPNKTGYEVQIWDYQPAGYNTGSLVDSLKAAPVKILEGQWNDYNIKAVADHYVVVLNGKTILDDHDSRHAEGLIGFQCQPGNKIEFRNVKLLPLKQ